MNQKQLKQLIKPLIKECMAELMLEMKFDQVIGEAISKSLGKINIVEEQPAVKPQQTKDPKIEQRLLEKRRQILDSMHAESSKPVITPKTEPKNMLESVLRDTEDSGFEIQDEGNTNPEFVSADTVDELLGGQDLSKFL